MKEIERIGHLPLETSRPMNAIDPEQLAEHAEHVRALARRLVFDAEAADDVVQDACLAALRHPPKLDVPLRAWLVGVVRNLAARSHRDHSRRHRAFKALAERRQHESDAGVQERVHVHRDLIRAVQRLPEPYQTTLLLRYFDGLPVRVVAVRMGVPPATVSTRIHRGLFRLRAQLDRDHRGRSNWLAVLFPLAERGGWGTHAVSVLGLGGLVMGMKTWLALAFATLIALFLIAWPPTPEDAPPAAPSGGRAATVALNAGLSGREGRGPAPAQPAVSGEPDALPVADRARDLFGRVVDTAGRPVAGATVETHAFPWQRATLFNLDRGKLEVAGPGTKTAADGRFAIRLRWGQQVSVRIRAAGHAEKRVVDCVAGERLHVILDDGAHVRIRARDEAGDPVEGVSIRIWSLLASGLTALEWSGVTDALGTVSFEGLPIDVRFRLEAIHARYGVPRWLEFYPRAGALAEIDVVMPTGRVQRGRVVDAETGKPISGARVGLGWTLMKAVRTDPSGAYELAGVTSFYGSGPLYATAPGYAPAKAPAPHADGTVLRLTPGAPVVGRVVGIDHKPIGGAFVAAVEAGYENASFGKTGPDGRFTLPAVRRNTPHSLIAYAEGHGRVVYDFVSTGGEEHGIGDVILPPPQVIEGVVLDAVGTPKAGVPVELRGANADRDLMQPGIAIVSNRYGSREVRRTDDLGRFRFPDLAPGTYALQVQPARDKWTSVDVTLPEGKDVRDVAIKLAGGHRLRVRVEDGAGQPIAGVNVTVYCKDLYQFGQYTDPSGTFEVESDSPFTAVEASTPFQPEAWDLPPLRKIQPGEQEAVLVLRRAGRVSGRLLDPHGKPIPHARIQAFADGLPFVQLSRLAENSLSTNAEGAFEAVVPLVGAIELIATERVQADGTVWGARLSGLHAGAKDIELRMAPVPTDRSLSVRVLRPGGGPAKDVQVYVRIRGSVIKGANVRTDDMGHARLEHLPAGRVIVLARPTAETQDADGWLPWSKYPIEPAGQEITIRFVEAVRFAGRVVDDKGQPLFGADVGAWHGSRPPASVKTDEDGRFVLRLHPDEVEPLHIYASLGMLQGMERNVDLSAEAFSLTLSD